MIRCEITIYAPRFADSPAEGMDSNHWYRGKSPESRWYRLSFALPLRWQGIKRPRYDPLSKHAVLLVRIHFPPALSQPTKRSRGPVLSAVIDASRGVAAAGIPRYGHGLQGQICLGGQTASVDSFYVQSSK